mmetsp:Transcript_49200/g.100458  ORF Transcript_49200/g.100458 Transcript_49200/m.100458 type:complete len:209 (-) Transcript_49200:96-722(-)
MSPKQVVIHPRNKPGQPAQPRRKGPVVVTLALLKPFKDLPLRDAAEAFGCCESSLKHGCRRLGIKRWPFHHSRKQKNAEFDAMFEDIPPSIDSPELEIPTLATAAPHSTQPPSDNVDTPAARCSMNAAEACKTSVDDWLTTDCEATFGTKGGGTDFTAWQEPKANWLEPAEQMEPTELGTAALYDFPVLPWERKESCTVPLPLNLSIA